MAKIDGDNNSDNILTESVGRMNRLSIRFNGKEIIGATVTCERPKNVEEMTALLRELLAMREAPDVADLEVPGKYSPNVKVSDRADNAHSPAERTQWRQ